MCAMCICWVRVGCLEFKFGVCSVCVECGLGVCLACFVCVRVCSVCVGCV